MTGNFLLFSKYSVFPYFHSFLFRHGAWLTFGNVDLHLIKGRPAVHDDDDLIVSHIAITVSNMSALKKRLEAMNVPSRKNVSVPNPSDADTGVVEQQFVRDPDGYYIECCNCERLEKYLHDKMAEEVGKWNFSVARSVMNLKGKMLERSEQSKLELRKHSRSDDVLENMDLSDKPSEPDEVKMSNLIKSRKIYGDITQNASESDLAKLLRFYHNDVPSVILYLENKVRLKGKRTYIPPAFFERDGTFVQPPAFEMPIEQFNQLSLETSEAVEKTLA